mmetsp:Transcript_50129/g.64251  ORF Transcript_50129/g.64251 Transcript_50129/m.64251 type:complete len:157 (+) Transcript_50129:600-1070(+)
MSETLNDVLSYQKIEEGKLDISITAYFLPKLLDEIAFGFSTGAVDKLLTLVVKIAPDVPSFLLGDSARIRQILNNFVSNAIKFSTGPANIYIQAALYVDDSSSATTSTNEPIVEFSVKDNGIGISETNQKKLFQAFSQVDAVMYLTRYFFDKYSLN